MSPKTPVLLTKAEKGLPPTQQVLKLADLARKNIARAQGYEAGWLELTGSPDDNPWLLEIQRLRRVAWAAVKLMQRIGDEHGIYVPEVAGTDD